MSTEISDQLTIAKLRASNEIVTLDDGFKYWWPERGAGAIGSHDLRVIADYLDSLNSDWEAQIERDLGKEPNQ